MLARAALTVAALTLGAVACSSSSRSTTPPSSIVASAVAPTSSAASAPPSTTLSTTPSTTAPVATTTTAPVLPAGTMCGAGGAAPARYEHVVWIWMENHTAGAVLDSPDAPFEQSVAQACGSTRRYRSVGSPSLPNYLGATSGSTHGVHDDGSPAVHPISGDNLFRQVRTAGGTARSYEEAMPRNCALDPAGRYAVKHNPQPYYIDSIDRAACQTDDVPLGTLQGGAFVDDLAHDRLPTFSFVTPDLCNDTHDCSVATGDAWLHDWLGLLTASSTYREGRTLVFVVWDEPTPMPLLVLAPSVPAATTVTTAFDHYALLRTTEDVLGLPALGSAATAATMRDAFNL